MANKEADAVVRDKEADAAVVRDKDADAADVGDKEAANAVKDAEDKEAANAVNAARRVSRRASNSRRCGVKRARRRLS